LAGTPTGFEISSTVPDENQCSTVAMPAIKRPIHGRQPQMKETLATSTDSELGLLLIASPDITGREDRGQRLHRPVQHVLRHPLG
jgi:hypothetical protein